MCLDPMIDSVLGSPDGPGVVLETILPEQLFRPSAALPPERRLMLAVLETALLDLRRSAGIGTPRARRLLVEGSDAARHPAAQARNLARGG